MNNWLNIIQNKLLPPRCILCGRPGNGDLDLCAGCLADLPRNAPCCYRCGEHFDIAVADRTLCGRCLAKAPHFDAAAAPFLYQGNMRYLIAQLKYNHQYAHARLLAALLAQHLQATTERPECLIAVPLHPKRYRQRGFNQALEIGRHLAKQLAIPLDFDSSIRGRDTPHQTDLLAKQRRKNMRNAFRIVKPLAFRHVAILDDVMTTGATLSSLALALKENGVERVDAWVCARA